LIDNSYFLVDLSLFFWLFCAVVSWLAGESGPSGDAAMSRRTEYAGWRVQAGTASVVTE